jgi:hypothetical protein
MALVFSSDDAKSRPSQIRICVNQKVIEVLNFGGYYGDQDKIKVFDASVERQFCYKTDDDDQEKNTDVPDNEPTREMVQGKSSNTPRF